MGKISTIEHEVQNQEHEERLLAEARTYIEQHRKCHVQFDRLVPNQKYKLSQISHDFPFGTAFDFEIILRQKQALLQQHPEAAEAIERYFNTYPEQYRTLYESTLLKKFDGVTTENSFAWPAMNRSGTVDWTNPDATLNWLKLHPELLQNCFGHYLFWNRSIALPPHLANAPLEAIKQAILTERMEIISRYPEITQWCVLNEPLTRSPRRNAHGQDQDETVLDPGTDLDFIVELFSQAKSRNPEAKLYLNEYSILSGEKTDEYIELIRNLLAKKAPLDGIGIQGHMWADSFADVQTASANLKKISELGLPIRISEFDVSSEAIQAHVRPTATEADRAKYITDMFTLFYGTPLVNGIYIWGFQEKTHWRNKQGEHAAIMNEQFQPNEAGKAQFSLIEHEWTTNTQAVSDADGCISIQGFPGRYNLEQID